MKMACRFGSNQVTYDEMSFHVEAVAQWLEGVLPSTQGAVGLLVHNRYWHWVTLLGLLRVGAKVASVAPDKLRNKTVAQRFAVWIGDESNSLVEDLLILPKQQLRALYSSKKTNDVHSFEATPQQSPTDKLQPLSIQIGPTAQLWIMTSGTTGKPKVVSIDAQSLTQRLGVALRAYGRHLDSSTRLIPQMGLDTIGGFLITLCCWLRAGEVQFVQNFGDEEGMKALQGCNMLSAAPARLAELLYQLPGVWPGYQHRKVRVGGARLSIKLRDELLQRVGATVQSTYGSTEVGLIASCDARVLDKYPAAAGTLLPGVQVQIVDKADRVLPQGRVGRVRCRVPGMSHGYEGVAAEVTRSIFHDGWFYPGDLGCLLSDGTLVIEGRNADVLNLGGVKVSALDVDARLGALEGVRDACVVPLKEGERIRLGVLLVLEDGATLAELKPKVQNVLPAQVPALVMGVDRLMRNAMGKLQRQLMTRWVVQSLHKIKSTQQRKDA